MINVIMSRPRKQYYVSTTKFLPKRSGGWKSYINTPSLARAKRMAKKLKLKYRQIDVRERGIRGKVYVLKNSWL